MDIKELKDLLLKRLYIEFQLFKDSKLRQKRKESGDGTEFNQTA